MLRRKLQIVGAKDNKKGGFTGLDANKKIKGRKRHTLFDNQGSVIKAFVTATSLNDREGLFGVFEAWKNSQRKLKIIWVDGGYDGNNARTQAKAKRIELITVKRSDAAFKVLARRWVVERTFAWLGRIDL